ncbi:hypothetical protein [Vibrio cholerae]|uniref:hypothetical protein n=1 Tax=Vibrio cholerae TaxID=666 RepID=UPI0005114F4F|nr:hypothetical protein [Vibrio cholerae]
MWLIKFEVKLDVLKIIIENWKDLVSILAVVVATLSSVASFRSASSAAKSANLAESQQKLILVQSISSSLQAICHGVNVAKETKKSLDVAYSELAIWTGQIGGSRVALANSQTEKRVSDLYPLENIALEKLSQITTFPTLPMIELISEQVNYEAFNQSVVQANMLLNQELREVMQTVSNYRNKAT